MRQGEGRQADRKMALSKKCKCHFTEKIQEEYPFIAPVAKGFFVKKQTSLTIESVLSVLLMFCSAVIPSRPQRLRLLRERTVVDLLNQLGSRIQTFRTRNHRAFVFEKCKNS